MESYLIRIYRRDKDDGEQITGTIQEIRTQKSVAFKNLSELNRVITGEKRKRGKPSRSKNLENPV